jgi:glutamate-5-semialdehyde dehydrogenase
MSDINLEDMGRAARKASRKLAILTTTEKNTILYAIADQIEAQAAEILAQNAAAD